MEVLRLPFIVPNTTRNTLHNKGSWGINVFQEKARLYKRPGLVLEEVGAAPGQGVFYYGVFVSIQADTLYVGETGSAL